jgi:hypothetical protein
MERGTIEAGTGDSPNPWSNDDDDDDSCNWIVKIYMFEKKNLFKLFILIILLIFNWVT